MSGRRLGHSKGEARMPACCSPQYLREAGLEVQRALAATDEEREAATVFTAYLLLKADAGDDDGPLVHGWAPHAAFLAGVRWQQRREREHG
jgi:hypothetical protein